MKNKRKKEHARTHRQINRRRKSGCGQSDVKGMQQHTTQSHPFQSSTQAPSIVIQLFPKNVDKTDMTLFSTRKVLNNVSLPSEFA